jgi:tetratricopeptide (TPR) repeat protein
MATYGMIWFFLNLVIESSIVPLELVFEHRLYLPSIGFALTLVALAVGLLRRSPLKKLSNRDFSLVIRSGFAIMVSLLAMLTFIRNEAWENTVTIYWDAAVKNPHHPRARANLAVALMRHGLPAESLVEAEKALSLGRDNFHAYNAAAQVVVGAMVELGQFEQAIQRGDELLRNQPQRSDARPVWNIYAQQARAYAGLQRYPESYAKYVEALKFLQSMRGTDAPYPFEKRKLIAGILLPLLQECQNRQVDLNGDGTPDPGTYSLYSWIGHDLLKHRERDLAADYLSKAVQESPQDELAKSALQSFGKESGAAAGHPAR